MLKKIVSGGQTGVDRAALDVALQLKISCGGWCPKGRKAEDGVIDKKYPLVEADSSEYIKRTELNVGDSDGTLVITWGTPQGGTKATIDFIKSYNKPYFLLDVLSNKQNINDITKWLEDNQIAILNIAGPRDDKEGRIYKKARELIQELMLSIAST